MTAERVQRHLKRHSYAAISTPWAERNSGSGWRLFDPALVCTPTNFPSDPRLVRLSLRSIMRLGHGVPKSQAAAGQVKSARGEGRGRGEARPGEVGWERALERRSSCVNVSVSDPVGLTPPPARLALVAKCEASLAQPSPVHPKRRQSYQRHTCPRCPCILALTKAKWKMET
jgi:hypothetical protein